MRLGLAPYGSRRDRMLHSIMTFEIKPVQSIAAFTCAQSWDSALPVIRIVGPAEHAGLRLIRGNQGTEISPEAVAQADVVVIQRDVPRYADAYAQIIARARAASKPVICDLDDLLFDLPETHPAKRFHYYQHALVPTLGAILTADVVTVSTPPLYEYVREFNPNTWLLPNYLDDHLWTVRQQLPDPHHRPVVLGFMGGEAHVSDLQMILGVLLGLLRQYGDQLRLKFWGCEPPPELRREPNVEFIPFAETYPSFARRFSGQNCDIFVAPLLDTPFNRSKSAIKFLEYSALGVPGVYSRLDPYERVVSQRQNGLLATTPEEWKQALDELICHPDLRYDIGRQARQTVLDGWLLSQHAHEWTDVYRRAIEMAHVPKATGVGIRVLDQVRRLQRESDLVDNAEALAAKDRQIDGLRARLDEMTGSAGWRFVVKLRAIRLKLVPYGTRREGILKRLLSLGGGNKSAFLPPQH